MTYIVELPISKTCELRYQIGEGMEKAHVEDD